MKSTIFKHQSAALLIGALCASSFPVFAQQPQSDSLSYYDRLVRELQTQDLTGNGLERASISDIERRVREGEPSAGYRSPEVPQPPGATAEKTSGAGAVSKKRLAHKPPKAARRAFDQGSKASQEGKNNDAVQFFSEAVRLDSAYWEAHRLLADAYGRQGDAVNALEHLEAAIAIDPNSETLQSNKARALLALKRPAEAEAAAHRALQLAPFSEADHYLLALALLDQDLRTEETARHLAIAANKYPSAMNALEGLRKQLSSGKR